MRVNIAKTEISRIDYKEQELPTNDIRNKGAQLVSLSPKSLFKFLGILLRLDLDDTDAITYAKTQTAQAMDKLSNTCYTTEQLQCIILVLKYQHQYSSEDQST